MNTGLGVLVRGCTGRALESTILHRVGYLLFFRSGQLHNQSQSHDQSIKKMDTHLYSKWMLGTL